MGIKGLTKTITKYSPESITNENLYKLSGKKVAVDASLILYQQLLKSPGGKVFKNSKGKMCVTKIELNPQITFANNFEVSKEEMIKMQDRSHRYCFVANSLSDEVEVKINI